MSSSGFEFDDSLWPLLIIRFVGIPSAADLETYLAKRLEYMQRHQPHVHIYDTREARMLPHALIQRHVAWMKQHDALRRETLKASAVIVTSPVIRLAASTLLHFFPSQKTPYRFFTHLPEAVSWLSDWMQKEGHTDQAHHARRRFGSSPGWRDET